MIYQTSMVGRDVEEFDSGYGESSRYAAHLDRGWALLDRGDLVAARTSVEHAQEVRPDDPDASVLLGAIALAEGDPAEALRCYERAAELDPEYLEPYVAAAQVCLFDLEDPGRALRFCEDALELEHLSAFEALDLGLLQAECVLAAAGAAQQGTRGAGGFEPVDLGAETPELGQAEDLAVVLATLELAARGPTDADLEARDPVLVEAAEALMLDNEGDRLDEDEQRDRVARAFQLLMRWARLKLDLGEIASATEQLGKLTAWFPEEADAWYLLGEARLRSQDVLRATEASLRTLELDTRTPLPGWLPPVGRLQRRVLQTLQRVEIPAIQQAIRDDRPIAVLIQERPAPELVAEGIDPRLPALALGTRLDPQAPALTLTGIAIYVANIARVCRDATQFEEELKLSLDEELGVFFADAAEAAEAEDEAPTETPAAAAGDDKKPRRRRRRKS
ncbi:MAG: tetratricopeptide repeat protein [Nannocystaceae bacterium]|nr:tetratricopeptide repeat protein [bacterium]